jgi:hypothetical protein
LSAGSKRLAKIADCTGWASYILNHVGDGSVVNEREYVPFLNMWMAKHLALGKDVLLGKYLLGAAYHLMYYVAAQLLKNKPMQTISGPWWLIQLWLNLYVHKIVRPDFRDLSFPSSNFNEEYRGEEGRTCQYTSYGEAASAIIIDFDVGHLFKKFYRGFDAVALTWLPYNEDDELTFPFKF